MTCSCPPPVVSEDGGVRREVTEHVHGSDPDTCDRCWDVVIDQRVEEGTDG